MLTTFEGAIALLLLTVLASTRPALAHDHAAPTAQVLPHAHHHPDAAPAPGLKAVLLASHVFRVSGRPVAARLYDARAYYQDLHRAHPHHPGIPTHRLELLQSSTQPVALTSVILTRPGGERQEVPLVREGDRWVADLELRSAGPVRLTLAGVLWNHATWSCTLRP